MKRVTTILLALILALSSTPASFAASGEAVEAAETLYSLGLFQGKGVDVNGDPIFALDDVPTRYEGVTMLVRLLGKEKEAKTGNWETPFTDVVEWAKPYVGYAYANGITGGTGPTSFGGSAAITATQYLTFVLRALGYKSGEDFKWDAAWELSDQLGLTDGRYSASSETFLRGDVAIISVNALEQKLNGSPLTLYDKIFMKMELNAAEEAAGFDSFEAVEQMAAENHAPYTSGNARESMNIDQYAISDKALLTQSEMVDLRTEKEKADHITIEQAKEDVDLFFRTWKYCYPSYYFMGEEVFLATKEQALADLDAYPDGLSGAQMGDILYEAMSFLQDNHSSVDGKSETNYGGELYYLSYLDNSQTFDRDETGYYQIYKGEKWYFASSDHADLRIEPTLLSSGKVVYCPMLLAPCSEAVRENEMVLVKDGEKKNVALCWTVSEDVSYTSKIDTQCKTQASGDIYYIDYLDMNSNNGDVNDFLKTAKEAKKYKAVIFDLRHTQGWEHWQFIRWLEIFTGNTVNVSSAFLTRNNALRTLRNYAGFKAVSAGYEDCSVWYEKGKQTDNDIPIIILTDKSVLSSTEESLLYLKTLDNTIVIGSNSRGCSQGGSVQTYYLPHSGVPFAIGGFMKFQGEAKNIDGIGYEPDIWCNPAEAFSNALMFLQNYGIVGEESVQPLYLQSLQPVDLRILWHGNEILPGQVFGCISERGAIVYVTVDGQQVYDFTVRSEAPEMMTAEPTADGKIRLTKQKSFDGGHVGLVITYEGKDYQFYCND